MEIHSSHALGIAWISASREIFKKLLTFECFYFGILFSILWEFTLSISGKMNSHSTEKILGKHNFFAALQVFFNVILMMSMMKNNCKAPKIKIMKNTALQELDSNRFIL